MVRLKNGVSKLLLPAAAAAGLLLAGVGNAGAAPVIEYSLDGGASFSTISPSTGSQTVGAYTITGLSVTATQSLTSSVLDLSFSSLTFSSPGESLLLEASDTGFTYDPATAYLNSAASTSVNESAGSSGGDTISMSAGSDSGNATYAFSTSAFPSPSTYTSPGSPSGGTYTPTFTTGQTATPSINSTGYSLSTLISAAILGSVGFNAYDSFGPTTSTAFITTPAGPALAIPATGWLSLVGGSAMFGGLAIRRRMKS